MAPNSLSVKSQPHEVTPDTFRQIMGSLPTGVTVVTVRDAEGVDRGLTVNAFTSVSLEPPLVLVCLHRYSSCLEAIRSTNHFAVNILEGSQEDVARRFADRIPNKFEGVNVRYNGCGVPVLTEALAYAECEVTSLVEAGDHVIVIGRVVCGGAQQGDPLLYFRRRFASMAELGE